MAIRIGPPPTWARLRIYWHTTRSQYQRNVRALRAPATEFKQGTLDRWRQVSGHVISRLDPRVRAQIRQRSEFARFAEQYDELVDLLCWAAKDGVHTDRDKRYTELRTWMQSHYHRVRPQLRPHLSAWEGALDPFEELFAPESVDAVINDIAGIQNVIQTREAMNAYSAAIQHETRTR